MEVPQIGECANTTESPIYYKKLCILVVILVLSVCLYKRKGFGHFTVQLHETPAINPPRAQTKQTI